MTHVLFRAELFLNLCWLLLAIPAVWVWLEAGSARGARTIHSRRSLLLLACVVLLLFPVISASDDLQAMRPEIEEGIAQDGFRNSHACRCSPLLDHRGVGPALTASLSLSMPDMEVLGGIVIADAASQRAEFVLTKAGRAPPLSFLG